MDSYVIDHMIEECVAIGDQGFKLADQKHTDEEGHRHYWVMGEKIGDQTPVVPFAVKLPETLDESTARNIALLVKQSKEALTRLIEERGGSNERPA